MTKTLKTARRFSSIINCVEVTDGVRYVGTLRKCNAGTIAKPVTCYEFKPKHGAAYFVGEKHESAASLLRKVASNMAMFPDAYAE